MSSLVVGERWSKRASVLFYVLFTMVSIFFAIVLPLLGFLPNVYTAILGSVPLTLVLFTLCSLISLLLAIWYVFSS